MDQRILITGACGLVGTALACALRNSGAELRFLDIAARDHAFGDVRDLDRVRAAVDGCDGVFHLAAISRVIWGEQQPETCRATNVGGVRNVLEAAAGSARKPWLVFASSREVYGEPGQLPVNEATPLRPMNVYARTKVRGEALVEGARNEGVRASVVRLSNVFGSTDDHADRVAPAFARAAALSEDLRVDGANHTLDFTHIDDVAAGLATLASLLGKGGSAPPPIHFVTGVPTTLRQLAEMAIRLASSASRLRYAPPRDFDVARFVGSPERARRLLGWTPTVSVEAGLCRLVQAFREKLCADRIEEVAP